MILKCLLNHCFQEIIFEFLLWVRHRTSCLGYMEHKTDPQEAHSLEAGIGIHLIYHTTIALQTAVSAVEEKSNVFWEHVTKRPNLFLGLAQLPLGRMAFDLRSEGCVEINWERRTLPSLSLCSTVTKSHWLYLWNVLVVLFYILILDHCNSHLPLALHFHSLIFTLLPECFYWTQIWPHIFSCF